MVTNPLAGLRPLAAILLDVAAWDSSLRTCLEIWFVRISKLLESRGLPIIMIDFPEAGKVFDLGLSSGFFDWDNLPKTFGRLFSEKGVLFEDLFERCFEYDGNIRQNLDPNLVFLIRQVLYFAKKVEVPCGEPEIHKAVSEFKQIDESLRVPTLRWDLDQLDLGPLQGLSFCDGYRSTPDLISHRDMCPRPLLRTLDLVTGQIFGSFPELDRADLLPRHGPGAVADARSGTDKYLFPTWPRKLDQFFHFELFAQSREDMHLEFDSSHSLNEPPARLLAVPKTLKGPRLIASEPVAHQYTQGALMRWIRKNLPIHLRSSINFLDQVPSREGALAASKDGKSATIDLSSASDRLSCWVVERALRRHPELLLALHASRTRWLVNATGVGERFFLKLRKFAAQGSAATFPVQSMVYASMAIAALLYERGVRPTRKSILAASRQVRVFGDDIIMPSHAVQSLVLLLTHCELKVNMAKSHIKGCFRESCGMDAYMGEVVSPVYIRQLELSDKASALVSWIDVSNNAYKAGLWNLARWMLDEVPHKVRKLIPISNESLGCVSLCTHQTSLISSKKRVSKTLFREEILALQVTGKQVRHRRDNPQSLLQYFLERPPEDLKWSSGWTGRIHLRLKRCWVPV